uniref:DH domain-containing protein n=1 Tax=Plectus sambesii TaxID=2011161 RepID=A0A914VED6_9BILA
AFYSDTDEAKKSRSPWILKRLYDWSHRAKTREIVRHVQHALGECDREFEDEELNQFLSKTWHDLFPGSYQLPAMEQKRLQAVWELFHSELKFLNYQLLVLRNVYKEPLKNCQVEGCLLTVEPDLLFGNLDELCQISVSFCREFLNSLSSARITK